MPSFLRVLSFAAVTLFPCLALAEEPLSPAAPSTTVTIVLPAASAPLAAPTVWTPAPSPDTVIMHRRNTGVMIGGFAVTTVGIVGLVSGVLLVDSINSKPSSCNTLPSQDIGAIGSSVACGIGDSINRDFSLLGAWTLAIAGGVWTLGGITMSAIGGTMVPLKPKHAPKKVHASVTPAVSVGIGSMSATWSF
jgi:hypothetical protein